MDVPSHAAAAVVHLEFYLGVTIAVSADLRAAEVHRAAVVHRVAGLDVHQECFTGATAPAAPAAPAVPAAPGPSQ